MCIRFTGQLRALTLENVHLLREPQKARKLNCSCLIAVEVEGVIHISGNVIGDSPKMLAAYGILFEEEERKDF